VGLTDKKTLPLVALAFFPKLLLSGKRVNHAFGPTVSCSRTATTTGREVLISTKEKEEKLEMEGEVVEALRGRMFRVLLDNGHETIGYTAGKMKRYRIKVFLGDRVKIELSPYDLTRGRIVYRYR
jgi:translation initiation factor IF-1